MILDTAFLTPALAASVITLFLKWCLDLITSNTQFRREKKKIVLQRQIEVTENAMCGYMEMWEALYALKSVMERFSVNPSPAQLELLQRAINGVNHFQEKSFGHMKAIQLYYDCSSIAVDFQTAEIDKVLLDLSDVISKTCTRIEQLRFEGDPNGLMQVEFDHIVNSYHLYAKAIDCKMKSIQAVQDLLRKSLKKI